MGLFVINPGLGTTVQDLGRGGLRGLGVPSGGAFDRSSSGLANALLGNDARCALLELSMIGGQYRAETTLGLALAGAPFAVKLDRSDHVIDLIIPLSFTMKAGDQLIFGRLSRGVRAYLAVLGGWQTPDILGSRSSEVRLVSGQILAASPGTTAVRRPSIASFLDAKSTPVRLIDGPETRVPPALINGPYLVRPSSDRIGQRLKGEALIGYETSDRRSSPVATGAVQIAGGQPIILGVAGGTMGGYPHVAHVITADLDRLAQARPGESLRFERVDIEHARELDRQRRKSLGSRDRTIVAGALGWPDRRPNELVDY